MASIKFYERSTIIKRIETVLNQINQRYFEGNYGILSVIDNGDFVTVCSRTGNRHFDVQNIFDALNNFSLDGFDDQDYYDIWDYLDFCKYILPENQETENELKTDDELSFSEKRQAQLVDMLLSEPVPAPITESFDLDEWTVSLIPQSPTLRLHTEASTLSELVEELETKNEILEKKNQELEQSKEYNEAWIDNLKQKVHDLECAVYLLQQETNQITVLNESVTQLHIRIHELEQENKQLKNQSEPQPKPKPEPKPTAKRPKFKLPENFADYQQECNDLINGLSSFYNIKKGKWNGNILQFVLTPTDAQKEKQLYPYPDKWKAGLYLQPGQWTIDKVNLSDPDEWEDWFMDINDFADANDIEIS